MTYFYIPHNAPHSRSLTLAPPSLRTALRPAGSLARSLTQIRLRSRAPPCRQNMRRALRALYAGASYTSDVCKHLHLRRFLHRARVCLTLEQTEAQQHRANLPASRSGELLRDCQQPRDTSDERLPASRADAPCVALCARLRGRFRQPSGQSRAAACCADFPSLTTRSFVVYFYVPRPKWAAPQPA